MTDRIKASLDKSELVRQFAESEQVAPTKGLSQIELIVLATLAGNTSLPGMSYPLHSLKIDSERSGLSPIGFSIGFKRLAAKEIIKVFSQDDGGGDFYQAAMISSEGWDWIESNESLFVLRRKDKDDDIPF